MRYFLIAGEASGDMHAASLMDAIKHNDTNADFVYFGGDLMEAEGGTNLKHYREMAFMGIVPVLLNLHTIAKNLEFCKQSILKFQPDTVILIDYAGFNLRIAKFAKAHNIKTSYYISPKVWAWKTKRVKKIKAHVDHLYSILPFEENFFKKYNYPVEYVGNPTWDIIRKEMDIPVSFNDFCTENHISDQPIIALLPGSRKHEIKSLLPIMEALKGHFPNYQFVIAGAPGNDIAFYQKILSNDIKVVFGQTYKLLRNSKAAVVASGTATLETALLSVPQVVIYKMNMGWILERVRKYLLKVDFFSLVNLVAEKEVVKELFHSQVTVEAIKSELNNILNNSNYRLKMLSNYLVMQEKIDTEGAAKKAARLITNSIKPT